MGLDKKFLSESYKRMPDEELLSVLANDMKDLTEEARDVLKEELTSRGLGKGIDNAIELQLGDIPQTVLDEFSKIIREMPCPVCSGTSNKLNAVMVQNNHYVDYAIACPKCLDKVIGNATGDSIGKSLLGVGSIVKSINNVVAYRKMMDQVESNEPSEALIHFIRKRAGEIELCKEDKEKLSRMIKNPNATIY